MRYRCKLSLPRPLTASSLTQLGELVRRLSVNLLLNGTVITYLSETDNVKGYTGQRGCYRPRWLTASKISIILHVIRKWKSIIVEFPVSQHGFRISFCGIMLASYKFGEHQLVMKN